MSFDGRSIPNLRCRVPRFTPPPFRPSVEDVTRATRLNQGPDPLSSSVTDVSISCGRGGAGSGVNHSPASSEYDGLATFPDGFKIPSGCARRSSGFFGTAPRHGALAHRADRSMALLFALAADVSTRYWALTRQLGLRTLGSDARDRRCAPAYCCSILV